ncbi:MAG: acyl-CoA dehydratase activase [Desulfomonilia bacterium]|nr:acyl-CoA dehydratase activase [Deltaproteobacteria bacterium]
MIVAGCDIGSLSAKAVVIEDGSIIASHVIRARPLPRDSAREVMGEVMRSIGLSPDSLDYCVSTGYGRNSVEWADSVESEIACHAKGAWKIVPDARMVIDIGGQDAKAVRFDDQGNVVRYVYNDKCASGTGRFLEIMAEALDVRLEDMGAIAARAQNPVTLSNQCVVFAETEIISLINEGRDISDIISGLHTAMASRVASLARSIELAESVTMSGGVAKNPGMFAALQEALQVKIRPMAIDPQIVGALGAAVIAMEKAGGNGGA